MATGSEESKGDRVRVFKFGLHPPKENRELVEAQMGLAHKYRNDLVRIELDRRSARRSLASSHAEVADAEADVLRLENLIEGARLEIKAARASTRSRSDTAAQKSRVTDLLEQKKAAKVRLREVRASLRNDDEFLAHLKFLLESDPSKTTDKRFMKRIAAEEENLRNKLLKRIFAAEEVLRNKDKGPEAVLAAEEVLRNKDKGPEAVIAVESPRHAIDDAARAKIRAARSSSGLHWGTYQLVEDAAEQASKSVTDPRFCRWTGDGRVGIHVQDRILLCPEVFVGHPYVRIDPVQPQAWDPETRRGDRRRLSRTVLHMRVGPKDDPRWASWDMIMHRPLPDDGEITNVSVSRRKVGPKCQWTVEITVKTHQASLAGPASCSGAVAVHFGWIETDGGLRVATYKDEFGAGGSLVLHSEGRDSGGHPSVVSGLRKVDDIKSIRSRKFEEALGYLCGFLSQSGMPEWMRLLTVKRGASVPSQCQALNYLSGWRSQARLANLVRIWSKNRFDGDEQAYRRMEGDGTNGPSNVGWRYNDFHLWKYEANLRQQVLAQRQDVYRVFARSLARRYATCVIDDTDYSTIARKKDPEGVGEAKAPRTNRQIASVSSLRLAVRHTFSGPGSLIQVKAAGVSMTCPECGTSHVVHKDVPNHMFVCSSCTFQQDMDGAALLNTLRRGGHGDAVNKIIRDSKKLEDGLRILRAQTRSQACA